MIKKIEKLLFDILAFIRLSLYRPGKNDKIVVVDFKNPQLYHRFFYLMLKFYQLEGYSIYYPMSFSTFRNLRNKDHYLGLIVREKKFLNIKKTAQNAIVLKDDQFSPDYFHSYFKENNKEQDCFHIPMSFHPYMYSQGIWNNKIDLNKQRTNAIFCYGNFDNNAYLKIMETGFSVIPRSKLLSYFKNRPYFVSLSNKEETFQLIKNKGLDSKLAFAIKDQFPIAMPDIRVLLSEFNFYFCCPGVVMPLCHNIIEAMSVGTIPILQKEYAEVMYPSLENNVNALLFEDLNELDMIIYRSFELSETDIEKMKKQVLNYYEAYLSPSGMISQLNTALSKNTKIYLQAEHRSIQFIK